MAAGLLVALAAALALAGRWVETAYGVWTGPLLASPMAWVRGLPLYPPVDSGAYLDPGYPPLWAMVFAPAAGCADLGAALLAASATGGAMVLAACLGTLGTRGRACLFWGGLLLVLAWVQNPALVHASLEARPDGPAMALAVLALATLARTLERGDDRGLGAVGALGALALLGKQTMVVLHPVLVLGCWRWGDARRARRLAAWLLAVDLLLAGWMAWSFDLRGLWFAAVEVMAHHPRSLARLLPHPWGSLLAAGLAPLVLLLLARQVAPRGPAPSISARLFLLAAGLHLAMGLFGMTKFGGDINHLAPGLLLLLLAALLELGARGAFEDSGARRPLVLLTLLLSLPVLHQAATQPWPWRRAEGGRAWLARFEGLLRDHPGEVYMPWLSHVHLAVEGRARHFSFGVFSRDMASRPLSDAHLRADLPERLQVIVRLRMQDHGLIRRLPEFHERHLHPDFPGTSFLTRPGQAPVWLLEAEARDPATAADGEAP